MYPDLYKGLGLKPEDLTKYDTSLVGFNGKIVVSKGHIKLLVVTEGKEVMASFIVVSAISPYTVILGWPWIHAMGVVPSTLHLKIKFPIEDGIAVVRVNKQVAWQCLVATINHVIKQKEKMEAKPL